MKPFSSFFKRGPSEASATELWDALSAAEAERQRLREREQALAVSRQAVLLTGTDEDLDAIEVELSAIGRAAERYDLRIPELRRLHENRQSAEQRAADKLAFDTAVAQRLAIAERIDVVLGDLGSLFEALEAQATVLRSLDGYHGASRKIQGPMSGIRLDRDALRAMLLHHVPGVARGLGFEPASGQKAEPYRASEARVWSHLTVGPELQVERPQARQATAQDAEEREQSRLLAARYA